MDITNRIRHMLDAQHLSQAALARKLGVSQPFLSQVLNGRKKLSLELLLSICSALEISPAALFTECSPADVLAPAQKQLLDHSRRLTPEELDALNLSLEALLARREGKQVSLSID